MQIFEVPKFWWQCRDWIATQTKFLQFAEFANRCRDRNKSTVYGPKLSEFSEFSQSLREDWEWIVVYSQVRQVFQWADVIGKHSQLVLIQVEFFKLIKVQNL